MLCTRYGNAPGTRGWLSAELSWPTLDPVSATRRGVGQWKVRIARCQRGCVESLNWRFSSRLALGLVLPPLPAQAAVRDDGIGEPDGAEHAQDASDDVVRLHGAQARPRRARRRRGEDVEGRGHGEWVV
jgi:hypothetical protein